ncbi:hypothetical protein A0H81_09841 [Grifola frondosa]|uniref:Ribosome maturation protein SDO1/SBDS N-terminal domain-containing protein n=1 Tax=Grifola frondosa TaxID=5627 RepID=A0A1C7M0P6_GRIFR|nr:hypothetical protein A0H81_09841 [Grifola frondosa]
MIDTRQVNPPTAYLRASRILISTAHSDAPLPAQESCVSRCDDDEAEQRVGAPERARKVTREIGRLGAVAYVDATDAGPSWRARAERHAGRRRVVEQAEVGKRGGRGVARYVAALHVMSVPAPGRRMDVFWGSRAWAVVDEEAASRMAGDAGLADRCMRRTLCQVGEKRRTREEQANDLFGDLGGLDDVTWAAAMTPPSHPRPFHSKTTNPSSSTTTIMTKALTKVVYQPDTQSTDQYIAIVNPAEYRRWKGGGELAASYVDSPLIRILAQRRKSPASYVSASDTHIDPSHSTIPLTDVVDSFKVFFSNQGSQGLLGQASKQQLESVFGTSKDIDVVQQLLTKGKEQTGESFSAGQIATLNATRGSATTHARQCALWPLGLGVSSGRGSSGTA